MSYYHLSLSSKYEFQDISPNKVATAMSSCQAVKLSQFFLGLGFPGKLWPLLIAREYSPVKFTKAVCSVWLRCQKQDNLRTCRLCNADNLTYIYM